MDQPAEDFSLSTLRSAFTRREDPYAGVFLSEPQRIGGILTLIVSLIVVALGPASPPDEAIGGAGWAIWAMVVAGGLAAGVAMLRGLVGFDGLYYLTLIGVVCIGVLAWLAGGLDTPYEQLYLAPGILPVSIHPPRRALTILGFVTVGLFLPLAYDGWDRSEAGSLAVEAFFIWMLAVITMVVTNAVREQRLGLISEGEAAQRLARNDALTGLGNRLAFDEVLEREAARSRRSGSPLSLVILDLDHFKQINDDHGHLAGDHVLMGVASGMRSAIRIPDSCFRWGGDEFALLLPETTRDEAEAVGERLRQAVRENTPLPGGGAARFTFGVAQLREAEDPDQLVEAADAELVEAKRHGPGGKRR